MPGLRRDVVWQIAEREGFSLSNHIAGNNVGTKPVDDPNFKSAVHERPDQDSKQSTLFRPNRNDPGGGRVLITGGSEVPNELTGVAYHATIWDQATKRWTAAASAAIPRLYHCLGSLWDESDFICRSV